MVSDVSVWTAEDIAGEMDAALGSYELPGTGGWRRRETGVLPERGRGKSPLVVDPALCADPTILRQLSPDSEDMPIYALTACGYGDSFSTLVTQWLSAEKSRMGVLRMSWRYAGGYAAGVRRQRALGEAFYFLARNLGAVSRIRAVECGDGQYSLIILRMQLGTLVHINLAVEDTEPGATEWEHAWRGGMLAWERRHAHGITSLGTDHDIDEGATALGPPGIGRALETVAQRIGAQEDAPQSRVDGSEAGITEHDPHGGPVVGLSTGSGEPDNGVVRRVVRALTAYRESVTTNEAVML